MKKPIAVLISDVHYTPHTMELADFSYRKALAKAEELNVPLIDAGDTLDSKDLIRARCANALISTLKTAKVPIYILVGNHTLINEKGSEHALNFLAPYATVVDSPSPLKEDERITLIPYQNDANKLKLILEKLPTGQILILHQGVQTAFMGHYVQDKTSLPKHEFAPFRAISGHYHRAQDIRCGGATKGTIGLFSYIGNPYTLSFGEAGDPPKGYAILMDDGSLERVPLGLRKHRVVSRTTEELDRMLSDDGLGPWFENLGAARPSKDDLLWFKLSGSRSELDKIKKDVLGMALLGHTNFKLDKIYTDTPKLQEKTEHLTSGEIMDKLVDNLQETIEQKELLKRLWKELV